MHKCIEFLESRITMTHAYLGTAGMMTFQDFLEGHYPYGLCLFALAVMEEFRNDKS